MSKQKESVFEYARIGAQAEQRLLEFFEPKVSRTGQKEGRRDATSKVRESKEGAEAGPPGGSKA